MKFYYKIFSSVFILVIIQANANIIDLDIVYNNKIYNDSIYTTQLHINGDPLSYPIINLNSETKIKLSFDDFHSELQEYYYTIIHCDASWRNSQLMQSEYIDGFFEQKIEDYEFSFNTLKTYTHYSLIFPNENLKPIISGNYIIAVYKSNNLNDIVFTKRFMILENKVNIEASINRSMIIEERNYKQQVKFSINHNNLVISNPYSDIKVLIKQNNRNDNYITNLIPEFVKKDKLVYNFLDNNIFYGNNEFRNFDIKSIRYQSERIQSINSDSNLIYVNLFTDISRSFDEYFSHPDLNGNFFIKKQEAWNSDIEAEYVNVYFSLLENREISYADIYIIGRFTDWNIDPKYKLKYNSEKRRYEVSIFLKQGYYNYAYILKNKTDNKTSSSFIEGTHYESNNDYYIYVYHRENGSSYDQLIGYYKTKSDSLF